MERDVYQAPASDLSLPDDGAIRYAGFWIRVGASVIDTILMGLIIFPLLTTMYGTDYWMSESFSGGPLEIFLNYIFPAVAVILFWLYRSATPGKMLCSLKIVSTKDFDTPGFGQLIGRYFAYYLSMIPFFLSITSIVLASPPFEPI